MKSLVYFKSYKENKEKVAESEPGYDMSYEGLCKATYEFIDKYASKRGIGGQPVKLEETHPDEIRTEYVGLLKEFDKSGVTAAKKIMKSGESRIKSMFKWGAKGNHIVDLRKTALLEGKIAAGELILVHGGEHKQIKKL